MMKALFTIFLTLFTSSVMAQVTLEVQKVEENVYALVGELTQRSKDNLGNNSTHGVIITDEGVILIDSGASYLGAKQIHEAIQKLTNKPIKIVINSGGQDHRWLGNDYFQKLGAKIIASSKARADQKARADGEMTGLEFLIGDSLKQTNPFFATEVFDDTKQVELGGVKLDLYHFGPAHTAGDIFIHMPSKDIIFSGDIVFNDRMLGIGPAQNFQSWINVFEKMASFKPKHIIPGHGKASDLATATKNTYDYLLFLKAEIAKVLDDDGDMLKATKIDQSKFDYLKNHKSIAGKNAQWVFEQMEFDY
jgi:glyoxylase-like metal-dependent hydrolase (beta-lactamase superfamily II)